MWKKTDSRALIATNSLLTGQIVLGAAYLIYTTLMALAPGSAVDGMEWIRTLTIMVVAGVLLLVVNRKKGRTLAPGLTRAEKLFKMICIGVCDVAICLAITYLLSLPLEQSELSINSVAKSLGGAVVTAVVFLGLWLAVPRLKLFRQNFSQMHNFLLLIGAIGFGWSLAWLGSMLMGGPDGTSDEVLAAFAQQVVRRSVTTVALGLLVAGLALSGKIEAKLARARIRAKQTQKKVAQTTRARQTKRAK